MNAGELRQRVDIFKPSIGSDEYGQSVIPKSWVSYGRWASVRPMRAAEVVRAQQAGLETSYTVRMRFIEWLTSDCVLFWRDNGLWLDIANLVDVNGRGIEHELVCIERKNSVLPIVSNTAPPPTPETLG